MAAATGPRKMPSIAELRINPAAIGAEIGVRKVINHIPVRKPKVQEWVRVHPDHELETYILKREDGSDDHAEYLVDRDLWPETADLLVPVRLHLTVNRSHAVAVWPIRLPGVDGKDNDYWRTAREAAIVGREQWIRIAANQSSRCYDLHTMTSNTIIEPRWPALDMDGVIKIAWKNHYITTLDHPVLLALRGEG